MATRNKGSAHATARTHSSHSSTTRSDIPAPQENALSPPSQQPEAVSMLDTVPHNTVLHAAAHVSGVFVASGSSGAADGSAPSSAAAAAAAPTFSADSAKSQKLASPAALLSPAESQALGPSRSRDTDENVRSTSSPHPIASVQRGEMSAQPRLADCTHQQHPVSTPPRVAGGDVALPGVGVFAPLASPAPAPSLLEAAFASAALAFQAAHSKVSPPRPPSPGMVEMKDAVDADVASSAAADSLAAWASHAHSTHCLIADISRIVSEVDRKQFLAALSDSLAAEQRMDAVKQWLKP